jgi:hypothetical protein
LPSTTWVTKPTASDITGIASPCEIVSSAHNREPVAIFTGEVLPLYAADIGDDAVRILLNELASEIGRILEQEEVHIAYRDRTWTLKASIR